MSDKEINILIKYGKEADKILKSFSKKILRESNKNYKILHNLLNKNEKKSK